VNTDFSGGRNEYILVLLGDMSKYHRPRNKIGMFFNVVLYRIYNGKISLVATPLGTRCTSHQNLTELLEGAELFELHQIIFLESN